MPGGLICEMETFHVIDFFFLVLKILARTERLHSYHTDPCNNCRLPRISFNIGPARLLFASHTWNVTATQLTLKQSVIRTTVAELWNDTVLKS